MAGSTWNIEEMNHHSSTEEENKRWKDFVKGYVITEEPKKKHRSAWWKPENESFTSHFIYIMFTYRQMRG